MKEKAIIGGFTPKALKNENGDRFFLPSAERVETKAMGRGPTPPKSNL